MYGPGGLVELGPNEKWHGTIGSIAVEDLGAGLGDSLVVRASVPKAEGVEWSLIGRALLSTGSPLLKTYPITAADGNGLGGSAGGIRPGANAWLYPATK